MDYQTYYQKYFTDPQPEPRFKYKGLDGLALFFSDYAAALEYYARVLGPPAYIEGDDTRGWRIGDSWLTLFPSPAGNPQNVEVQIVMETPEEAERLQAAFIAAGGTGENPSDQLMYGPIRYCPVKDPFGTDVLIIASLPEIEK
jgi:hypothetical protein